MKKKYFAIILYGVIVLSSCQKEINNADRVTNPDTETNVYIAGSEGDGVNTIAKYWKNGVAVNNITDASKFIELYSIYVSGNDVYVAGKVYADNPVYPGDGIARYWKNGIAVNLSDGVEARSIIVSGNDVYVAGYGAIVNTCPRCVPSISVTFVAKYWKNGVPVILSDSVKSNFAYSIAISGSDVYVAGGESVWSFNTAKYWKNGQEVKLSSSLRSEAYSIAVSGNDVYVAGREDFKPTYWKNGIAVKLSDETGEANSIAVSGSGDVYVTGVEPTATGFDVKYWKNGNPVILALNTPYNDDSYSIAVSGNDIYVAGPGGYWKNGIWVTLSDKVDANAIFIVKQ